GRRGEEPSWAEAELLKERPRTGQAVPSEPAEELLRSMCRHQPSKHQSNQQESNRHVISLSNSRLEALGKYNLTSSYMISIYLLSNMNSGAHRRCEARFA